MPASNLRAKALTAAVAVEMERVATTIPPNVQPGVSDQKSAQMVSRNANLVRNSGVALPWQTDSVPSAATRRRDIPGHDSMADRGTSVISRFEWAATQNRPPTRSYEQEERERVQSFARSWGHALAGLSCSYGACATRIVKRLSRTTYGDFRLPDKSR